MVRRVSAAFAGLVLLTASALWVERHRLRPSVTAPVSAGASAPGQAAAEASVSSAPDAAAADDGQAEHEFRMPTGRAPALSCDEAHAIVGQAREQLGYEPEPVDPHAFADAAADWLDPYGLWSVAPDTPLAGAFERGGSALLADLERRGSPDCPGAESLGAALAGWVGQLRQVFDDARHSDWQNEDAASAQSAPAFEGATVTRPARTLAAMLGRRAGALDRSLGPAMRPYTDEARDRYFPELDARQWGRVILAAAVRAYVPEVDPHGAWAPFEEESSVYELDLEARPPVRLWDRAERTAVGFKIESGATPPLADGDVVLSLGNVLAGGLSYEQIEQLGYAAGEIRPPARLVVLRAGEAAPVALSLDGSQADPKSPDDPAADDDLPIERIEYGRQDVLVVTIHDVRDDLGDALTRAILREREREPARALAGVVLDLRGNGGGSTDGAIDALGLFIPGATLFPMRRRDGSLETDRAPEPPGVDRWRGPVAALVDGDTASAAEMLAGAIEVYHRGPVIGARTFGKGCAQEYLDDDAHAGVLRLTTLLYALPDGTPVQRVGLSPTIHFPFATSDPTDREATLSHAPPLWRGPDVRDRIVLAHSEDGTWTSAWPAHGGNVGPCKDADVCRALRLVGATPTARRIPAAIKGR